MPLQICPRRHSLPLALIGPCRSKLGGGLVIGLLRRGELRLSNLKIGCGLLASRLELGERLFRRG